MDRPTLIGADAFHGPAAETPGVDRREAFADDHVWAARSRLEFGPGGSESVDGGPGDFVLIPRGVVHREGKPGTQANEAIVFRVGEGEVLVTVDGP